MSDSLMPWAWTDGRLVRIDAPVMPLSAPALLRGEGIFETMACVGGHPRLFDWHYERLARSARALGLRLALGPGALRKAVEATLARNRVGEAAARVMLMRGARRESVAVVCRRAARPGARERSRGVALEVAPWRRAAGVPIHRHKTLAYWECQRAREWAEGRGAFDALFLTPEGWVLEGGMTNVFCVRGGTVRTPPVSMGLLPGVMRRFVLAAARELYGLRAREERLTLRDLLEAEEVFVTNAVAGAVPVRRIGGRATRGGTTAAGAFQAAYEAAAEGN